MLQTIEGNRFRAAAVCGRGLGGFRILVLCTCYLGVPVRDCVLLHVVWEGLLECDSYHTCQHDDSALCEQSCKPC